MFLAKWLTRGWSAATSVPDRVLRLVQDQGEVGFGGVGLMKLSVGGPAKNASPIEAGTTAKAIGEDPLGLSPVTSFDQAKPQDVLGPEIICFHGEHGFAFGSRLVEILPAIIVHRRQKMVDRRERLLLLGLFLLGPCRRFISHRGEVAGPAQVDRSRDVQVTAFGHRFGGVEEAKCPGELRWPDRRLPGGRRCFGVGPNDKHLKTTGSDLSKLLCRQAVAVRRQLVCEGGGFGIDRQFERR